MALDGLYLSLLEIRTDLYSDDAWEDVEDGDEDKDKDMAMIESLGFAI